MNNNVKQWLRKAENDLISAEHELSFSEEEMITDTVCFHAQQAVEKFLKAFLISNNYEFGNTHNLEYLLQLCGNFDKTILQYKLGNLTSFAVKVRYPDNYYSTDYEDAKEAFKIAKTIKEKILPKIKGENDE